MRHLNLNDELPLGHIHVRSEGECATLSLKFDYLHQSGWSSKFKLILIAKVNSCYLWERVGDKLGASEFDGNWGQRVGE